VRLLSWRCSDLVGQFATAKAAHPRASLAVPAVAAGPRADATRHLVNWLYAQPANGQGT